MRFERPTAVSPRGGVQRKRPEAGGGAPASPIGGYGQSKSAAAAPVLPSCRSALLHSGATWRVPCWNDACTGRELWATWFDQPRRTFKNDGAGEWRGQECQSDEVCLRRRSPV